MRKYNVLIYMILIFVFVFSLSACTKLQTFSLNDCINIEEAEDSSGILTVSVNEKRLTEKLAVLGVSLDNIPALIENVRESIVITELTEESGTDGIPFENKERSKDYDVLINVVPAESLFRENNLSPEFSTVTRHVQVRAKAIPPETTSSSEVVPVYNEIDAFDGVEVVFSGISPDITASVDSSFSPNASILKFKLSKNKKIQNGEEVIVTAECKDKKYVLKEKEKSFVASGMSEYVMNIYEIPDELFQEMQISMARYISAWWTKNKTDTEYLNSAEFQNAFMTLPKNSSEEVSSGKLYLVFKIDAVVSGEPLTYYWGAHFKTLPIKVNDGQCSLDLEDFEEDNVNIESSSKLRIKGYISYSSLFNKIIASKSGTFNCQERSLVVDEEMQTQINIDEFFEELQKQENDAQGYENIANQEEEAKESAASSDIEDESIPSTENGE